jgi:hypothetical protein
VYICERPIHSRRRFPAFAHWGRGCNSCSKAPWVWLNSDCQQKSGRMSSAEHCLMLSSLGYLQTSTGCWMPGPTGSGDPEDNRRLLSAAALDGYFKLVEKALQTGPIQSSVWEMFAEMPARKRLLLFLRITEHIAALLPRFHTLIRSFPPCRNATSLRTRGT